MLSLVANNTVVHIFKGWLSFFMCKAAEVEANLTACTFNGRSSFWMGALRLELQVEASLFEYGERPPW